MQKVTLEDGQSANIINENIAQLRALFPDAFTESGVDLDVLRQLIGDTNVLDSGEEKYGLNWHGKKQARQIALTPSAGTLLPCPEKSIDWDATQNLFIEGDNLEVLKLLQKSYANSIKLIFIDPPYNTGKEFIYPDNFKENLDTYLKYTGQVSEEGMKFSSSTESSGRKHTNWLNMMYPRLKAARNLLTEDGSVWVTIDDNELGNIIDLGKNVFGDENFVAIFVWQKRKTRENRKVFSTSHDYVVCFAKNKDVFEVSRNMLPLSEEARARYSNPDGDPRGEWQSVAITAQAGHGTKSQFYTIETPSGRVVDLPSGNCWRFTRQKLEELIADNRIWFGVNGANVPRQKMFLSEADAGLTPHTLWLADEVGTTDSAKRALNSLFDGNSVFDTPKPTGLIKRIIQIACDSDSLILDFFAGSCTTAHAVMERNIEDGARNPFIMVQLPEFCAEDSEAFKAGYTTISELGAERVRRASVKIKENSKNPQDDLGFKFFKLAASNIIAWNPDRTNLEETLLSHKNHLVDGRSETDVLYELLLKRGVDLNAPVDTRAVAGKSVYCIGFGVLFACLNTSIKAEEVDDIAHGILAWHNELEPETDSHVFFRDSAFADDIAKTNMAAILEQNGISHVRSL